MFSRGEHVNSIKFIDLNIYVVTYYYYEIKLFDKKYLLAFITFELFWYLFLLLQSSKQNISLRFNNFQKDLWYLYSGFKNTLRVATEIIIVLTAIMVPTAMWIKVMVLTEKKFNPQNKNWKKRRSSNILVKLKKPRIETEELAKRIKEHNSMIDSKVLK